jgi:hypothetical protein
VFLNFFVNTCSCLYLVVTLILVDKAVSASRHIKFLRTAQGVFVSILTFQLECNDPLLCNMNTV